MEVKQLLSPPMQTPTPCAGIVFSSLSVKGSKVLLSEHSDLRIKTLHVSKKTLSA